MWVEKRLQYYDACEKGFTVSWESPSKEFQVVCCPPSDYTNPNTYFIPQSTHLGGLEVKTINCELFGDDNEDLTFDSPFYNWGLLHAHIEELFRQGWAATYLENL